MRPDSIKIHRKSADLELVYGATAFRLPAEYLRVHSPSAEVQGHGPGQAVLQYGKRNVQFNDIQAMGHYAIRIIFSDGHDTGIYSWPYLRELCDNYDQYWSKYLENLKDSGQSRDPAVLFKG